MEAVVSGYPQNQHAKAQRNRHSRSVDLVTRQSGTAATKNYYPRFATFSDGNKQPPLLPLPVVVPTIHQTSAFSPSNKKKQLARPQSLTTRRSPPSNPQAGPRPNKVTSGSPGQLPTVFIVPAEVPPPFAVDVADRFSSWDSVFALSPPPSSLPLPRFCLRPKLRCNAEAVVDSGATDGLRRVLHLR